jgi:hypothetical protein
MDFKAGRAAPLSASDECRQSSDEIHSASLRIDALSQAAMRFMT